MKIIPIHYKVSRPVKRFAEIKSEAEEMIKLIDASNFPGLYDKAYAIAHAQVSETPYAFFVVSKECVEQGLFDSRVIINPAIPVASTHVDLGDKTTTSTTDHVLVVPNTQEFYEPCLSFPFRQPKKILRYDKITVKYQIPGLFGLIWGKKNLSGIASEIFQHEFDHTEGRNIYFESETPVKWWELIGTAKSLGGTSLDNPADLNLKPSKERSTN